MPETTVTAHLPGLDIEITRKDVPGEQAEALVIGLKATPSFAALGSQMLGGSSLLGMGNMGMGGAWGLTPLTIWTELMRQAWSPWINLVTPPRD